MIFDLPIKKMTLKWDHTQPTILPTVCPQISSFFQVGQQVLILDVHISPHAANNSLISGKKQAPKRSYDWFKKSHLLVGVIYLEYSFIFLFYFSIIFIKINLECIG